MLQHSTYHDEVRPQPFVRPSTTPAGGVSARPIGARHARATLRSFITSSSTRACATTLLPCLACFEMRSKMPCQERF